MINNSLKQSGGGIGKRTIRGFSAYRRGIQNEKHTGSTPVLTTKMKYKPLTREQLIKNAVCCGNKCLNCPYKPKHIKGNKTINEN